MIYTVVTITFWHVSQFCVRITAYAPETDFALFLQADVNDIYLLTFRSNQMHYFYYLKLKTIYNISLWYTTNCLQFFKFYPTCFGASFAPSSGVSLNQIFLLSWPSVRYVVQLLFRGWFKDTPEDGAETCRVKFKKLKTICSVSKQYIVNSFK
jgi:hypothetical protein